MKRGNVYLVGAGPGDPGLLTVKGMGCLSKADVVVYDHLLDEKLLESASSTAERIYAGKSSSSHAMEQSEINRLLVEKAGEGKTVVRLKGGDPFVFGRGGEEAEALNEAGIPFEIVPGVSSSVAVPAYAGIPVTHRGLASSFAVVTGHEDPTKADSSINWPKLASATDTLVFLMGMQNLSEIAARLVRHGRSAGTPVAVIKEGTRPEQTTAVGTLGDIAGKVKALNLSNPAVIVVGDVVSLRGRLRWFDNRPLFGKRVLVTRARHQASSLSRLLVERGAQPVELPVIEIERVSDNTELDRALLDLPHFRWVIFTSVNGVDAFFGRLTTLGRDSRALTGLRVMSIGPATAAALKARGIVADYCPQVYTGAGIIRALEGMGVAGDSFLLPRADIADTELAEGITRLGGQVHEVPVYQTSPGSNKVRVRETLDSGKIDVITFASSSTVSNLMKSLDGGVAALDGARIACIGPKTAETARKAGLNVDIMAAEHTIPGLVEAIEQYYRDSRDKRDESHDI
jgi:uroporphyrinogen III methyltransferase/synthase